MEMREAVIVDTVRTPIGKRKGALAGWHPTDLLAFTLQGLVDRTGVDPERVDDVVGGCVTQVGEQGCNVIRNGWVAAGLPQSVPCTSVDRQCGSSQQAVHFAAQGVMSGCYDLAIACGVESMTRSPMASNASGGIGPVLAGLHGGVRRSAEDPVRGGADPGRPVQASPATTWTSSRSSRTAAPRLPSTAGAVDAELVPVPIKDDDGRETGEMLEHDEGIRPRAARWSRWPRCRRPLRGTRRSRPTSPPATRRRCPTAPPRC